MHVSVLCECNERGGGWWCCTAGIRWRNEFSRWAASGVEVGGRAACTSVGSSLWAAALRPWMWRIEWTFVRIHRSYREDMNHSGCESVENTVLSAFWMHVCFGFKILWWALSHIMTFSMNTLRNIVMLGTCSRTCVQGWMISFYHLTPGSACCSSFSSLSP